jgi:hypothetical protein
VMNVVLGMGHHTTWVKEVLFDFREGLFEEAKAPFGDRSTWAKMTARPKFQSSPKVKNFFRPKYQSFLVPNVMYLTPRKCQM